MKVFQLDVNVHPMYAFHFTGKQFNRLIAEEKHTPIRASFAGARPAKIVEKIVEFTVHKIAPSKPFMLLFVAWSSNFCRFVSVQEKSHGFHRGFLSASTLGVLAFIA
jgi:hypothetical protein